MFFKGLGCYNVGMFRVDCLLMEKFFVVGFIKVLVCTVILVWGVNLFVYIVVIKGM